MLIKIIALIVPVGLDAFGVSAALAVAGLARERRLRTWLALTTAETAMPVLGILVGRPLVGIGGIVDTLAAGILLLFAVRMLREDDDDAAVSLLDHGMLGAVVLALSVGADELAIGLELGVLRAPLIPTLTAVVLQALLVSLGGLWLVNRVGERMREGAERLAGAILALVAVVLLLEAILGS